MPNVDVNKLKILARNNRLSAADRKAVADAIKEVESLNKKIQILEASQRSATALKKNGVVKKMIADETSPLKKQIAELQTDKSQETRLKANPKVKSLIQKEVEKNSKTFQLEKAKFHKDLLANQNKIKELSEKLKATGTQPIQQKDFNNFLSNSIRDLQHSFDDAKGDSTTDIVIRDVDIEATVITEMKNNQPVLVIPSREDMKELGSQNFQKVKYSLSVIPKDIEG